MSVDKLPQIIVSLIITIHVNEKYFFFARQMLTADNVWKETDITNLRDNATFEFI